ncbi:MAG: flagellar hook-basal body complex protein [Phycisphaerales bacterium]|nr:flagellar hook-basal body complex protein [Phycisphaerales bacterium]
MASTVALFTGLSGLNAQARAIDVIGNNIANVNTTGYKSARLAFSSAISRTVSIGAPPSDTSGGTNPTQIGMGVQVSATQRDFTGGTISATGNPRDLAIDGEGFFIINRDGNTRYSRAGNFTFDSNYHLTTVSGDQVLGYPVDENYDLLVGEPTTLSIPIGQVTLAESTTEVRLAGNLNASGDVAQRGTIARLGASESGGFTLISTATVPPTAPNVLEEASLLVEIEDPLLPGSDTPLFAEGQTLTLTGARKGGQTVPSASLLIEAATTLADLMSFLEGALGIQAGAANPDGNTSGLSLDTETGELTLVGNTGASSDLDIESADLRLFDDSGTFVRAPFDLSTTAAADGESVRTTFTAFDSLGNQVEVDVTLTLVSKDGGGTTWRYDLSSADDTGTALSIGTGELSFDSSGRLSDSAPVSVSVARDGTGAESPLAFNLAFVYENGGVTALADSTSQVAAVFRDGAPIGTLESFSIGRDGIIYGSFSNTAIRPLGQVLMAVFQNKEGLVDEGGNLYRVGADSGQPTVTEPGLLGSGEIVSGALELSNVDIGREFINLVLASTGYNASSRVIRTTSDLMDELLSLIR